MSAEISPADDLAQQEMKRLSRRSFTAGALAAAAGFGGLAWMGTRPLEDGLPWPLRRILDWNDRLGQRLFRESRMAATFPLEMAEELRVNEHLGLKSPLDVENYRVRVTFDDRQPSQSLPLATIQALSKVELVTELKCVEGWSRIVHWGGVRFAEFAAQFKPTSPYVGLTTPDQKYQVSYDIASIMHPQTLLCWELNGQPLSIDHGAPLRLVCPNKYGWKSLKRIGTISFTSKRPRDSWVERGYDWYAGL